MLRFLTAVALASAVATAHAAATTDDHVALFKNVTGSMRIVRADAGVDKVVDAVPGATLSTTDRVISGPGSTAGIVFKDGTLVTVGPSTEIQIRDYAFEPKDSKFAFGLYLAKGQAIYSSGKIGKLSPESVKVESPTATVGVRGTRFIIKAE
jgi:hypothetical protein